MRSFRVELGSDAVAVIVHAGDVGEWTGGLAEPAQFAFVSQTAGGRRRQSRKRALATVCQPLFIAVTRSGQTSLSRHTEHS